MSLSHETLLIYYKLNFQMMHHHKYSLEELENMMPWEREIYTTMLTEHIEQENKKMEQQSRQQ